MRDFQRPFHQTGRSNPSHNPFRAGQRPFNFNFVPSVVRPDLTFWDYRHNITESFRFLELSKTTTGACRKKMTGRTFKSKPSN